MMSSANCSEIPYNRYFHIIKNTIFGYLFNLVFIILFFRYRFSLKYYPQVFSLMFIASASKYFTPLSMRQSFEGRKSLEVNTPING